MGRRTTSAEKTKTVDELVAEFVEAATLRGAAFERGDPEADVQLSRLGRIRRVLDARGEEGRTALIHLLHHAQPWVQIGAATFTVDFAESETVSVLRGVSEKSGISGLIAKALLDWCSRRHRLSEDQPDA